MSEAVAAFSLLEGPPPSKTSRVGVVLGTVAVGLYEFQFWKQIMAFGDQYLVGSGVWGSILSVEKYTTEFAICRQKKKSVEK